MTSSRRLVMLIGSPRSGTTWLQSMLGAHPEIATPQETDLFAVYVKPLLRTWDRQLRWQGGASSLERRAKGLPLLLTEDQFIAQVRGLVDEVVDAVGDLKPSARVVLEKSPSHSSCVPEIVRVVPDAAFIHIVRDGRDVARSLVAASSDGWGSTWAPDSVAQAARVWRTQLTAARTAAELGASYVEVRYETLRGPEGAAELHRTFEACGVDIDEQGCRDLIEAHELSAMRDRGEVSESILTGGEAGNDDRARREPEGFFRSGGERDGWREAWTLADRRAFNAVAGDVLVDLGYENDTSWIGGDPEFPFAVRAARRAASATAGLLRSTAARLDGRADRPRRRGHR